jgi:hypothetical protein
MSNRKASESTIYDNSVVGAVWKVFHQIGEVYLSREATTVLERATEIQV